MNKKVSRPGLVPPREAQRRYLDEALGVDIDAPTLPPSAAATHFRRDVFERFTQTRSVLSLWTVGRFIGEYRPHRPAVITLDDNLTVEECLHVLRRAGILGAPVVNRDRLVFLGFHDVSDLLNGYFAMLERVHPRPPLSVEQVAATAAAEAAAEESGYGVVRGGNLLADEHRRRWIESLTADDLAMCGARYACQKLSDARAAHHAAEDGRMVYKGKHNTTLLDLVRGGFLRSIVGSPVTDDGGPVPRRHVQSCHRVAVYKLMYDPDAEDDAMVIETLVTQTDVIRFMHHHVDQLGAVAHQSLRELGFDETVRCGGEMALGLKHSLYSCVDTHVTF